MDGLVAAFNSISLEEQKELNERELLDRFCFQQEYSSEGDALKVSLFKTEADNTVFANLQVLSRLSPNALPESDLE